MKIKYFLLSITPLYAYSFDSQITYDDVQKEFNTANNAGLANVYQSSRIPDLVNSTSLLSNLNTTFWRLKFYQHSGEGVIDKITASFDGNNVLISIYPYEKLNQQKLQYNYHLNLVKTLAPNEAIFSYDYQGILSFMYIRLIMPHLLAIHMAGSFEEIQRAPSLSLEKIGIFLLE